MSRRLIAALAVVAATTLAAPAGEAASDTLAPCFERAEFLDRLSADYDEAPVAMGLTASGGVLEVVASSRGTWTIIVTMPDGLTCGVVSGESWRSLAPPQDGPAA